jgi:hypothetical protein
MGSQHSGLLGFAKSSLFLRHLVPLMFSMMLGMFHHSSMAQCASGGTITTSITTGCTISNGTLTITNTGSVSGSPGLLVPNAQSDVSILNNSGNIFSNADYYSLQNSLGRIGELTNSGQITASSSTFSAIYNSGTITVLTNAVAGTISAEGNAVNNLGGTIGSLTNSGQMRSTGAYPAVASSGNIINFTNTATGAISSPANIFFNNGGTVGALTNAGQMTATGGYSAISNNGALTNLTNTGTIENTGTSRAIYNYVGQTIGTLNNAGIISGAPNVEAIENIGTITTLVNTGTINKIINSGTISALNNQQGSSSSALSFSGTLPTNYNIIIRSATSYGQLAVTSATGTTTFGIYAGGVSGVAASTLTKGTYSSVLSGLTSSSLTGPTSGNYSGFTWSLNNSSGTIWDLIITGASTADTQQSLVNTANVLQNTYTLQNSVLANSFSYDCTEFGLNNVCISAGGRNTAVSAANGVNNTSALLIAAYRPHPNYRVGAYADQNLSVSNLGGTVNLGNNTPLIGLFGAWNERINGTGAQIKISAAYGQKNATMTRSVVGTSEPGTGSSQLNSQGVQVTAKYAFGLTESVIVSPYMGIRYSQNNMGGYTEGASSAVTAPLTYSALNTNATTALVGLGASYKVTPVLTTFASAGVETDTNTANGTYSATGITGLTPINFNANPVKTRPTAALGAYYDVAKNQRLGITGIYRQEPYQAVSTTTVQATYMIGL